MIKHNGGPAFPVPNSANVNGQPGMTLRDYFAAKAMQGFWASCIQEGAALDWLDPKSNQANIVARSAYAQADAMLKAREQ